MFKIVFVFGMKNPVFNDDIRFSSLNYENIDYMNFQSYTSAGTTSGSSLFTYTVSTAQGTSLGAVLRDYISHNCFISGECVPTRFIHKKNVQIKQPSFRVNPTFATPVFIISQTL